MGSSTSSKNQLLSARTDTHQCYFFYFSVWVRKNSPLRGENTLKNTQKFRRFAAKIPYTCVRNIIGGQSWPSAARSAKICGFGVFSLFIFSSNFDVLRFQKPFPGWGVCVFLRSVRFGLGYIFQKLIQNLPTNPFGLTFLKFLPKFWSPDPFG